MMRVAGIPVSPGLSIGRAVLVEAGDAGRSGKNISSDEAGQEMARFDAAVVAATSELQQLQRDLASRLGTDNADIFEAQSMMVQDPSLRESVETHIRNDLVCAERASAIACEEHAKALERIDDPYLAARADDLRDIGKRLARILDGTSGRAIAKEMPDNAVIVAADLTPSETASFDLGKIKAIVLDRGGRTSHTAILARSMGIPAVVGTVRATSLVHDGEIVVVDGEAGQVTINPTDQEMLALRHRSRVLAEERERLASLKELPPVTLDGKRIELAANIGKVSDADVALNAGAESVGLFRTEFLFIDRDTMPSEEEQFEAYRRVLATFAPHPVVIRTLDVGGDKSIPYLDIPKEDNPFLGLRAIRLCLERRDMFRIQLRALLRASVYGNLRIMFPMISDLGELRAAKAEVEKAREGLTSEGLKVSERFQVGIMVETPAAAVDADLLAPECDFFSIGTNDLTQYTMAADRGNPRVANLSDPFAPGVLRLIRRTIDEGHKRGIWVGMCGEMAGLPEAIPLLLGMGLDEFSMSPGAIPGAKRIIRQSNVGSLELLWDSVKKMGTGEEIRRYMETIRNHDAV